jgi:molybdopterin/thiamine biosynthesis adenylyltransferase
VNHVRHSGLFDVSSLNVTLIGAGGIGSATALTLAKMGVRSFEVWDKDFVSEENIATQLHKPSGIGKAKVSALREILDEFSDEIDYFKGYPLTVNCFSDIGNQVVISAVDSINARKDIWQALVTPGGNARFDWYLDARMAAEEFQLHIVHYDDLDWYDCLIKGEQEEDVPDDVCTMKSTFYTAMIAAGMTGSVVRRLATGMLLPHKIVFNIRSSTLIEL